MRHRSRERRGGDLPGKLALAGPPTPILFTAFFLAAALRHERGLLTALASSAFLPCRNPGHPMNGARTVVTGHLVGFGFGVGTATLLGASYLASAAAMIATIVVLIARKALHPPAISTTLGGLFARREAGGVFLVALVTLVTQRAATWTARRFGQRDGARER